MQRFAHTTAARASVTRTFLTLVVTGSLIFGMLPAQAWGLFDNKAVIGSGHSASERRALAAFDQIAVDLQCNVELIQDGTEGVVIETDDNLLPLVETVVKDGQLTIRPAKGATLRSSGPIRVTVNARTVNDLSLAGSAHLRAARLQSSKLSSSIAGSGRITLENLQSDSLSISIAGSGRFEAQGMASVMDVSIAGSGDVKAARLSAQEISVSIAGSGDATVWARKALSTSIVGSGNVRYYGDAIRSETSTVGSGRIRHLGSGPPV